MDSESEAVVLNKIAENISVHKREMIFKKTSCKVKIRIIQYHQHEISKKRDLNVKAQETLLCRQTKLTQLRKHLAGLRCFTDSMENCKTESNKSFYEQKEKNRRYEEESQKIIKIYRDKWTQCKIIYKSLPLAEECKVLQNQVKLNEFQLMLKIATINCLRKTNKINKQVQKQTKQNNIINFASFMLKRQEKENIILARRKNVEENKLKSYILFDQLKMTNDLQGDNFNGDSVKRLTNLPVKLNFSGYNLPEVEIPKQTISTQAQSSKSHFSHHNGVMKVVPMKESLKSTGEKQILHFSNLQKTNVKEAIDIDLNNKKIMEQNEYPEESSYTEKNKKIEVLNNIVIKPAETSMVFDVIKFNVNDNIVKSHSTTPGSVSQKIASMEDITEDPNLKIKLPQEIINFSDQDVPVERKILKQAPIINEQIKDDSEESNDNITNAATSEMGSQENERNEAMNNKQYYEDKKVLIRELKKKYSNMKLPQNTSYGQNDNLKQPVPTSPLHLSTPSVSKYFSKNENTNIEKDNSVHRNDRLYEETIKISNKIEVTNEKVTTPNTDREEKQTNMVFNLMESSTTQANNEYHKSILSKTETEIFGTQNMFMNTYASSVTSMDYSEYGDDSTMINNVAEFMARENVTSPVEKRTEENTGMESDKFLIGNGPAGFGRSSFPFFGGRDNTKDEKNQEKDTESGGFNVLFGVSDEKKSKSNFFDFFK